MEKKEFKCQFCGYFPRNHERPTSGSWYCPKCGRRTISQQARAPTKKFTPKKPQPRRTSRDQITSQIYNKLTEQTSHDYGLKEPYLNPKIQPIKPKLRKRIRIFSRQQPE